MMAVSVLVGAFLTAAVQPAASAQQIQPITVENGQAVSRDLTADEQSVIQDSIAEGSLEVFTDESNIDFDAAIVADNEAGEAFVMLPIANEGMEYSNLTVVLNNEQEIASYNETHFFEQSENSGRVIVWQEGEQIRDEVVVDESNVEDLPVASPAGIGDALSALNDCLSAAGIPAWVITAATAFCSFGSLPAYIACLVAAGVGGGTAGYCAAAAWDAL